MEQEETEQNMQIRQRASHGPRRPCGSDAPGLRFARSPSAALSSLSLLSASSRSILSWLPHAFVVAKFGAFGAFGAVSLSRTSHHKQLSCLTLRVSHRVWIEPEEWLSIWCIWCGICTPHEPPHAAVLFITKGLPSGLDRTRGVEIALSLYRCLL